MSITSHVYGTSVTTNDTPNNTQAHFTFKPKEPMELYGSNWEVAVGWIMVSKDKEKDDNQEIVQGLQSVEQHVWHVQNAVLQTNNGQRHLGKDIVDRFGGLLRGDVGGFLSYYTWTTTEWPFDSQGAVRSHVARTGLWAAMQNSELQDLFEEDQYYNGMEFLEMLYTCIQVKLSKSVPNNRMIAMPFLQTMVFKDNTMMIPRQGKTPDEARTLARLGPNVLQLYVQRSLAEGMGWIDFTNQTLGPNAAWNNLIVDGEQTYLGAFPAYNEWNHARNLDTDYPTLGQNVNAGYYALVENRNVRFSRMFNWKFSHINESFTRMMGRPSTQVSPAPTAASSKPTRWLTVESNVVGSGVPLVEMPQFQHTTKDYTLYEPPVLVWHPVVGAKIDSINIDIKDQTTGQQAVIQGTMPTKLMLTFRHDEEDQKDG